MKTCTKCGIEKEPEQFHRRANKKDGRAARCKACMAKQHSILQKARRNRSKNKAEETKLAESTSTKWLSRPLL